MNLNEEIRNRLSKFTEFGYEKQSNGTELFGKAPHIAPLAWLHNMYAGLTEDEISKLEEELETEIPKGYKEFLKVSNGLHIFNTTFCLDGLRVSYNRKNAITNRLPFCLLTTNIYERPRNAKKEHFFIGGYDSGDGSHLYIDKNDNKVYRCKTNNVKPLNEWNNLNEMILDEIDRLIEIHNENGMLKAKIKVTTPKSESSSEKKSFWEKLKGKFN
ncbi:SMI1/KNR4 family protein [Olleya marilimosa]|uniref:SMI1/KNR4 family protein n=1 Tax=Olleya marilimosa TaxID=272164 RepID=UPI0004B7E068|nr:SMI1/KNR4 family protein [Olleya marilimosa]